MRKLFVSDVDGTLVSENRLHLTAEFKEILNIISSNNDIFVLCSGRPTSNLIDLATEIMSDGTKLKYVAGFNGVEIIDLERGELIVDNSLSSADTQEIIEVCNHFNLQYLYFDRTNIRTNMPDNYWTIREEKFYKQPLTTEVIPCKSQKVLLVVEPEDNYKIQAELKAKLPNFDIFESAPHFIEIVKSGINKSSVVKQIMEIESIDHQNTYGFGDSGNDMELIKYANYGVVVANGNDKAKAVADIIIEDVDSDGVTNYLRSLYTNK